MGRAEAGINAAQRLTARGKCYRSAWRLEPPVTWSTVLCCKEAPPEVPCPTPQTLYHSLHYYPSCMVVGLPFFECPCLASTPPPKTQIVLALTLMRLVTLVLSAADTRSILFSKILSANATCCTANQTRKAQQDNTELTLATAVCTSEATCRGFGPLFDKCGTLLFACSSTAHAHVTQHCCHWPYEG